MRTGIINNTNRSLGIDKIPISIFAFSVPILFHYRSENPSATSFLLQTAIFLTSLAVAAPSLLHYKSWNGRERAFYIILTAFIVGTTCISILGNHNFVDIFRNAAPLMNFFIGACLVTSLRGRFSLSTVWTAICFMAFAALVVKAALVLTFSSVSISEMRYQIIAGGAPILCALTVASAFNGKLLKHAVPIFSNIAILFISVTRTYILITIILFCLSVTVNYKLSRKSIGGIAAAALVGLAALFVTSFVPGNPTQRWVERAVTGQKAVGYDLSEVMRKAENAYQMRVIRSSAKSMMLGQGIGAKSHLDSDVARPYYATMKIRHDVFASDGFGHNNYVSVIFVGGLLFGGSFLWITFAQILPAINSLRIYGASEAASIPLSYFAYLIFGLLAGTFGDRQVSLFFGMTTGSLLWLVSTIRLRS